MNIDIEENLKSFIYKMHEWETEFGNLIEKNGGRKDFIKEKMHYKLEKIFSDHCTNAKRKYGRLETLGVMIPPEYGKNENIENIENITSSKAICYTKQDNVFQEKCRYTLEKVKEAWLISKKERYDDYDKKWEPSII